MLVFGIYATHEASKMGITEDLAEMVRKYSTGDNGCITKDDYYTTLSRAPE